MRRHRCAKSLPAFSSSPAWRRPPPGSEDEVFEKAFSMEGVSRVSVENVNGPIAAQAWDRPYVKVKAVKSAEWQRRLGNPQADRDPGPQGRRTRSRSRRSARAGGSSSGSSIWARATSAWTTSSPSRRPPRPAWRPATGGSQAVGLTGDSSSDSVNGSIELRDIEGPVKATTVNGSVRVAFKGPLKKTRLETVNGSVEVLFDKSSSVQYDLETSTAASRPTST